MAQFKPVTDWDQVPLLADMPMAARIVGLCPEYLKKLAQQGKFPAFKVSSQWRVAKTDLMAFVERKRGA